MMSLTANRSCRSAGLVIDSPFSHAEIVGQNANTLTGELGRDGIASLIKTTDHIANRQRGASRCPKTRNVNHTKTARHAACHDASQMLADTVSKI